jgi:long-chain acyl-CoA synthetase
MNCLTFFHIGICVNLAFLINGATNVVLRDFTPKDTLRLMQDEEITWILVVPTEIAFILQSPEKDKYDLSSLKNIYYGAMPISSTLLKEAMMFFKCGFYQLFGSTEAAICSVLKPEDHLLEGPEQKAIRLQSAGRGSILVQLKVVDENSHEVEPGEVGEVVVKSESVMKGYWKLPEETARVLHDGWFHTGDMARIDEDGYIYVADRKKDMIISGGENIYPTEVEEVINCHPSVYMAAVIGVPDREWGESVKAVVVLKEGQETSEKEIIALCKERLAGYKKPKSVDFVGALPLNPAGKVIKRVLREKYWKGHDRRIH